MNCHACGRATILYGKSMTSMLDLRDGVAVRVLLPVQKHYCRHCRIVQTEKGRRASLAMMDACASGVLEEGVTGTARRLGCDRSVVQSLFEEWVAVQSKDLQDRLPDAIGLHAVDLGGSTRILVTDAVEETLIEVLEDAAALRGWLSSIPGAPTLAVIDLDPRMAGALEDLFPTIEIAVSPASASEAILAAADASLKAMVRRNADKGRNFRENGALLGIADNALNADQLDDLGCWEDAPKALRRMTRDLVEALHSGSLEDMKRVLDRAIANLSASVPIGALGKLLSTWRNRILVGVRERWLGRATAAATAISTGLRASTRSRKRNVRAFLLFSTSDRLLSRLTRLTTTDMASSG